MTDQYFENLKTALHKAGISTPTLVIDKQRLDHNIDQLMNVINQGFNYRIVAKSLPSVPLLQYIMHRTGTQRLMSFHLPFLMHLVKQIPAADILMGKPMPVSAAEHFYQWYSKQPANLCFFPEHQLQWLVDSNARLLQYQALAERLQQPMRINLEIDIGLHRGGFASDDDYLDALNIIRNSSWLTFSGLMGYEAHIAKIPPFLGGPQKALQQARQRYRDRVNMAKEVFGSERSDEWCLNTGGSTTYPLYDADDLTTVNELATASALVKPTDFDLFTLDHHLPAVFIAAPVLKRVNKPELPMTHWISSILRWLGRLPANAAFIYGGNWLASPCYPLPCRRANVLGHSSNQELYELPADCQLKEDDFIFFRPSQSESLFLQFGNIALCDDGRIHEWWPVFSYPRDFTVTDQTLTVPQAAANS
ncbi:MAG: type III pyridoxal 5-phosphate-dependent enzyme [Oceanospirillaceae bacterium]|uniref:DSD1 family PLP-dependent enzyme n=1 Tax=unclassified Thalassolituus TaxID=2624967 RepID=UPI000C5B4FF7|nr:MULTISPECIES: DSD1 family PLP-dependent enzyme [unclassified Thalassolituus]MAS26117.1 type III pyridoxal 5-phosphate-dependent enzyme [Oceanospirillaceae bacterium]MAY00875.1 type III pyridoxal 5-phosphate-dependent enzyme [Oceanospirillaceae bacterium]MBS54579.1 type III pyridoxal 5-phosphate-dependent enzyme [Oceanospirillaceae bacterium]